MVQNIKDIDALSGPPAVVLEASPNGTVVPNAEALFTGQYARVGDDLWIISENGQKIVIRNYFDLADLSTLLSEAGARLTPEMVLGLVGPRAPGQFAQAGGSDSGQPHVSRVGKDLARGGSLRRIGGRHRNRDCDGCGHR